MGHTLTNDLSKLAYLSRIELMIGDGSPRTRRFKFSILRTVNQLETLDLCEYGNIDEQEVNELTQLKFLKKLVLWKDELAPHSLLRLQAELPECKIVDFYDDW
ncbi:MAG: hypothetical protein L0228_21505 [Planctomycetes bacterium]|nr:hypothetical protein [Planctomycetota bacterium]